MISLGIICFAVACTGQNGSKHYRGQGEGAISDMAEQQARMKFEKLEHDFGTIIEGEKVMCFFSYRNTGGDELLLSEVEATCGCTVPEWSREPLPPGEQATLKVLFDASGRSGSQRKQISVRSNAEPGTISLIIKAEVRNN